MFNIGAGEMVFILIAALLVLGPTRLPELARGIGRFLREFRRQTDEVRNVVVREFYSMDEEIQREPAPPPAVPMHSGPSILPPPSEQLSASALEHPQAAAAALGEAAQAAGPAEAVPVSPAAAAVLAGSAEPAEPAEPQEEPLPRFDSLPGTVARNAPKQG